MFAFFEAKQGEVKDFRAIKSDTLKACDRDEWNYLEAIMTKLGFASTWVSLIMRLGTSLKFSILFSGVKLEEFKPTRRLDGGTPFLLICHC